MVRTFLSPFGEIFVRNFTHGLRPLRQAQGKQWAVIFCRFAVAFLRVPHNLSTYTSKQPLPRIESQLNLLRLFGIGFPYRRVGIFFWIWRFFNRRWHRLGGCSQMLASRQECFHFHGDRHGIQMPKFCEWKPARLKVDIAGKFTEPLRR